jgi:hypothetical protein
MFQVLKHHEVLTHLTSEVACGLLVGWFEVTAADETSILHYGVSKC